MRYTSQSCDIRPIRSVILPERCPQTIPIKINVPRWSCTSSHVSCRRSNSKTRFRIDSTASFECISSQQCEVRCSRHSATVLWDCWVALSEWMNWSNVQTSLNSSTVTSRLTRIAFEAAACDIASVSLSPWIRQAILLAIIHPPALDAGL